MKTAPSIFFFCLIQISLHLAILLGLGKLFRFSRKDVLIASNANVGGASPCSIGISCLEFADVQ